MSQADLISPFRFLAHLPQHLPRVPRMLRGLYYAGIRNREKNLSLAWALQRAAERHPERPAPSTPGPTAWPWRSSPRAWVTATWSR